MLSQVELVGRVAPGNFCRNISPWLHPLQPKLLLEAVEDGNRELPSSAPCPVARRALKAMVPCFEENCWEEEVGLGLGRTGKHL